MLLTAKNGLDAQGSVHPRRPREGPRLGCREAARGQKAKLGASFEFIYSLLKSPIENQQILISILPIYIYIYLHTYVYIYIYVMGKNILRGFFSN